MAIVPFLLVVGCREVRVEDGGDGGSDATHATSATTAATSTAAPASVSSGSDVGGSTAATGGASSTVGAGGNAITSDVFDPNEVYFSGQVADGAGGLGLIHWSAPSSIVTGFDGYYDPATAWVRPTDGRLVYINTFEATPRVFVCDDCPFHAPYPSVPAANDPKLPAPPCTPAGPWGLRFLMAPTGEVLHHCSAPNGPWYFESGAVALDATVVTDPNDSLVHLGYGGLALTDYGALVDLTAATATPILGWGSPPNFATARAQPDGSFLVVLFDVDLATSTAITDLWTVSPAAIATKLGNYPPYPSGTEQVAPSSYRIDATGALYSFAISTDFSHEMIVRRRITGESEILFDETQGFMKIVSASLVTGP